MDKSGLEPKAKSAINLEFSQPSGTWAPTETNEFGQTVKLTGGKDLPAGAMFSLLKPGVQLDFPNGFLLKFKSKVRGFLTWHEGSVSDGVPTPPKPWLLLSFEDDVPPFLIQFEPGKPQSLIIKQKDDTFTLETDKPYSGWVRISLPRGTEGISTNSAGSLGRMVLGMERDKDFWLSDPPALASRTVESDALGLTVTWTFTKPFAVIPSAFYLANLGGYPCRVLSGVRKVTASDELGPLVICAGKELTVRLPVRRVPTGRFLSSAINPPPLATASYLDVPTVVNLALETLPSGRDIAVKRLAESTVSDFLNEGPYVVEPHTGASLPFQANGAGIDLAAAHALLAQAVTSTQQATSEANSLLTSISWRRDWSTQGFFDVEPAAARRAGALAALAGALCPEPDRRLEGALFQAGIAGQRGLIVLRRRQSKTEPAPKLIEPLEGVRQVLFGMVDKVQAADAPLGKALLNEVRVYGDASILLDPKEQGLVLNWTDKQFVTLGAPYSLELQSKDKFEVHEALGFKRIRLKSAASPCRILLPKFAKPRVAISQVPTYTEDAR